MSERNEAVVAVVTGAGGGMGRAIVRQLTQGGARVGSIDRKAASEPVAGEHYYRGDLTDEAFLAATVEDCVARWGAHRLACQRGGRAVVRP